MFQDKTLQKICFSKEFCTFLHFLQCKFTLRKNLKDFSELVLTYVRPSKKCKDFMKYFPKNFDPIFGVAVAQVAVSRCGCGRLDDRKAGYGFPYSPCRLKKRNNRINIGRDTKKLYS